MKRRGNPTHHLRALRLSSAGLPSPEHCPMLRPILVNPPSMTDQSPASPGPAPATPEHASAFIERIKQRLSDSLCASLVLLVIVLAGLPGIGRSVVPYA